MKSYETVIVSVRNRVATVRLNRPEAMNAFDAALRRDLIEALRAVDADADVRIVVITGEGSGFCAGADLVDAKTVNFEKSSELIEADYKPILQLIGSSSKLYIAAVNGAAAGIGSSLALNCDLVVMAEEALIYMAFAQIGLVPDGGVTWHLVRTLGYKRALEMIVTAEKMPAYTCLELGLVNKVVPGDDLQTVVQQWAEQLSLGAPISQRYSKEIARAAVSASFDETFALEAKRQDIAASSKDTRNAIESFFKGERPVFLGE
ncbi:MAG: enoyl-CoA hydratase/isomerase family protein [bacterium]